MTTTELKSLKAIRKELQTISETIAVIAPWCEDNPAECERLLHSAWANLTRARYEIDILKQARDDARAGK
jgi:hypothetical protein